MKLVRGIGFLVVAAGVAAMASSCGSDESPPNATTVPDAASDSPAASETGPIVTGDGSTPGPTTGPIAADVAARAAVVLASCFTEFETESVLAQIYSRIRKDLSDYRGVATCIDARRNGCAAIAECLGVEASLTGPCASRCDGNISEGCDDQFKARVDCSTYGRVCSLSASGTSAGCTMPGAATCDPSSDTARRCGADGRPISCRVEREEVGPDCAAYGLTCVGSQCQGLEGSCAAVSGSGEQIVYEGQSCNGTKLVACVGDGLTTLDCGTLVIGSTCQTRTRDGGTDAYCGFAADCRPGDPAQATCDGDNVVVCNGGRIDKVDCKALGFTGCVAASKYAFCTPSLKATALEMQDGF
jgi:hypothetical protein